MSGPERITVAQFHERIRAQGAERIEDVRFLCPMCNCSQSAQDLIDAGAGENFEAVESVLAVSCVGRWTGAGAPRKEPDGKPCNWTLGGLFQTHRMEVQTEDGKLHPRFVPLSAGAMLAEREKGGGR